jgi:hypothetical protein
MTADEITAQEVGIDFDNYVDPSVQALRIADYADGDQAKILVFQEELLREQTRGWCRILFMDEKVAIVQWHDQFVLTLNDEHPLVAAAMPEVS